MKTYLQVMIQNYWTATILPNPPRPPHPHPPSPHPHPIPTLCQPSTTLSTHPHSAEGFLKGLCNKQRTKCLLYGCGMNVNREHWMFPSGKWQPHPSPSPLHSGIVLHPISNVFRFFLRKKKEEPEHVFFSSFFLQVIHIMETESS